MVASNEGEPRPLSVPSTLRERVKVLYGAARSTSMRHLVLLGNVAHPTGKGRITGVEKDLRTEALNAMQVHSGGSEVAICAEKLREIKTLYPFSLKFLTWSSP